MEGQGVPVPPLFGLRAGTVPPSFRNEKVKNLLSPAVNRGDLWRLNYNKTVFCLVLHRTPFSQIPESDEEWILPPHSPSLSPSPCSPSELVPPFFRPKLRPWLPPLRRKCFHVCWFVGRSVCLSFC